ncbi:MAG: TRAP transporter small permease subunit [Dethiobacteria bacterium]
MEWLANIQKRVQRLTYCVSAVSMFVLIPMMLLTTSDVITRTVFNKPIPGVVETSSFMLVIVILLGLAYTQQVKGHPRVTIFVSRLPLRVSLVVEIIVNLLCLYIVSIIVWQGWVVATGDIGRIVSDVLRISQLPFRLLVPVGGALLFLEFLFDLLISVEKLLKR